MHRFFMGVEIGGAKTQIPIGLANLLTLISAQRVSIGGVGKLGVVLLAPVRWCTNEYVLITNRRRYDIVPCTFADTGLLVGAILYAAPGLAPGGSSPR